MIAAVLPMIWSLSDVTASRPQPMTRSCSAMSAGNARRIAFTVLAVAVVVALIEAVGFLAWWAGTGRPFSFAAAAQLRAQALGDPAAGTDIARAASAAQAPAALHPFLGFVSDPTQANGGAYRVSEWGFVDDRSPLREPRPDTFVVGIVGGSVSLQFGMFGAQGLVAALSRSPELRGRRVEVVRLGLGGYKQPQQLIAVQLAALLGGHFDCIVNIDGFNEVALVEENVPHGVPGWYPRSWARLVEQMPSREQLLLLGRLSLERAQRADAASTASIVWWSPMAQFVWWSCDRLAARDLLGLQAEIERAPSSAGYAATGPGAGDRDVEAARAAMALLWARSSIMLHQLCEQRGWQYVHCLQPNQYVPDMKPIGDEEAEVALDPTSTWARAVANGYPLLRAQFPMLEAAGVPFTDMTAVFGDHPEPIYVDSCCHFGLSGNAILAEHVAAAILRPRDSHHAHVQSIETPALLELGPLRPVPLTVLGVTADGSRIDLRGIGMGTSLSVAGSPDYELRADGSVLARRRTSGRLTVRNGPFTEAVHLIAAWPDIVVADDSIRGADGTDPRLVVVNGPVDDLQIECTGLPSAPMRVVAVGSRPLPDQLSGIEHYGYEVRPVLDVGGLIRMPIPAPPANGRPVYVRVYALDADIITVRAASNTVVMTRG